MLEITEILDMLDWHMPIEIQSHGILLAQNIKTIFPFLQPMTPRHNKNVWENCAIIISGKSDKVLEPYLIELLEWLQDMNWPGAFHILDRLKRFEDTNLIYEAINICVEKARDNNNEIWERNLSLFHKTIRGLSGDNQGTDD